MGVKIQAVWITLGRQCYVVEAICLEIKSLDFGEVRCWEICKTCTKYKELRRLPKSQTPAAPLLNCSLTPKRPQWMMKVFPFGQISLFSVIQKTITQGCLRLGRCYLMGTNPKERWARRLSCHDSITAMSSCFFTLLEAWRFSPFLVNYMVKFHVWRGLLTLPSNLQRGAELEHQRQKSFQRR